MNREQVLSGLKQYFSIKELVCKHTYDKFGEKSWQFFSTDTLYTLLVIRRDILGVGMTINNWHIGGTRTQCGLRCNICQIPKERTVKGSLYLSAHCLSCAFDAILTKMTAEEARKRIINAKDKLPVNIRLEDGVSWLHVDTYDNGSGQKVYLFKE